MRRILLVFAVYVAVSCSNGFEGLKSGYEVPDPQDVVMYQVNPRVFAGSHSFNAVIEQLDSIRSLGVNVLWFMPIYEIGKEKSVNSPYCIKDYRKLNPEFGTEKEFSSMVKEAHARGMSVILDWVANHTSWDCDWIDKNPEWYTKDSLGNITYPAGTGWKDVADLDYGNQEMRMEMISDMKYWVDKYGVDGFRCDAADFVPYDFWQQAVTELRSIPDRNLLLLAEGKRKDHFDAGFDMNYAWGFLSALRGVYHRDESVRTLISADNDEYDGLAQGKVKLRFITNHDEAVRRSAVEEFGNARGAVAAFVATTFLHGGMLIYGSQEVGYPDGIDFFRYVPVDWSANPSYREEYRCLIGFYNSHPSLRRGSVVTYPDDDVLMFVREYDGDKVSVAVNLRNTPETATGPEGEIALAPYEYVLTVLND